MVLAETIVLSDRAPVRRVPLPARAIPRCSSPRAARPASPRGAVPHARQPRHATGAPARTPWEPAGKTDIAPCTFCPWHHTTHGLRRSVGSPPGDAHAATLLAGLPGRANLGGHAGRHGVHGRPHDPREAPRGASTLRRTPATASGARTKRNLGAPASRLRARSAALPVTIGERVPRAHGGLPARALRHDGDRRGDDQPARSLRPAPGHRRPTAAHRRHAHRRRGALDRRPLGLHRALSRQARTRRATRSWSTPRRENGSRRATMQSAREPDGYVRILRQGRASIS